MYRILTFERYTWIESDIRFDCLEDALSAVQALTIPWRIQVWIDIRNGPAEAGFWRDTRYWIDRVGPPPGLAFPEVNECTQCDYVGPCTTCPKCIIRTTPRRP